MNRCILLNVIISVLSMQMLILTGCKNDDNDEVVVEGVYAFCENPKVIKVLENEPAHIVEGCFRYLEMVSSFSIYLDKESDGSYHYSPEIFPGGKIPEKFQINGLPVLVSGNILDCSGLNACFLPCPECRFRPTNFFELKTIKINTIKIIKR